MLKFLSFFFLLLFNNLLFAQGKPISLDLNHTDLRSTLQLLADMADWNLILTEEVQGNVTLHLNSVSPQEAFDLLLKTKGLSKRLVGKSIWVAKNSELINQDKQNWQVQQQADNFAPLEAQIVMVRYAKASEVVKALKEKGSGVLSSRGCLLGDDRTHLIWLNDTAKHTHLAKALIRQLDIPLKQIMIEARIVNVDRSFEKNLGLHCSILKNTHGMAEEGGENKPSIQLSHSDFASRRGPLGFFVAQVGPEVSLDVELAALENEGKGEFISNPKLLTQDQKTAIIQAGEEIPFQEKTRSGATTVAFKKAVLSLEVTPRILPKQQLLLDLKVNQDAPGVQNSSDIPMIDTRQIETHVCVQSGKTLVLGGILEENKRRSVEKIPLLGDIPLIGRLFQGRERAGEHRELLAFITPTIVD